MSYQEELQKALAKREGERAAVSAELAARRILTAAGWDADLAELTEAVKLDPEINPDRYGQVLRRAQEMQADENVRGRRVPAETNGEEMETPSKFSRDPSITQAKREEIRRWLRDRRRNFPDLKAKDAHEQVQRIFGVVIREGNFKVTYWRQAAPGVNGKAPTARPKQPAAKPAERTKPAATKPPQPVQPGDRQPAAPPRPAPLPNVFHTTMLAIDKTPAGARVILDVEVEHEKAIELVGCIAAVLGPAEVEEEEAA